MLHFSKHNSHNDSTPIDFQQNAEQTKIVCHYCKKPGNAPRDCRNKMKKEQEQRNDPSIQNTKPSTSRSFALCSPCQRTDHLPENCWSGPNAANRPQRFKKDQPVDNRNDRQEKGNLTLPGSLKILYTKKATTPMGRLHISETICYV